MLYQLPNGKTIEISTEQYLRMSDEELNMYLAYNAGEELNDPFAISVLKHGPNNIFEEDDDDDFYDSELTEEYIEDLTDISLDDKFFDDDFIDLDNIEQ